MVVPAPGCCVTRLLSSRAYATRNGEAAPTTRGFGESALGDLHVDVATYHPAVQKNPVVRHPSAASIALETSRRPLELEPTNLKLFSYAEPSISSWGCPVIFRSTKRSKISSAAIFNERRWTRHVAFNTELSTHVRPLERTHVPRTISLTQNLDGPSHATSELFVNARDKEQVYGQPTRPSFCPWIAWLFITVRKRQIQRACADSDNDSVNDTLRKGQPTSVSGLATQALLKGSQLREKRICFDCCALRSWQGVLLLRHVK